VKNDDLAAGKKGADDFKGRIFGSGADKGKSAFFNMGEESILLSFVPAVDFVYEKDGFLRRRR